MGGDVSEWTYAGKLRRPKSLYGSLLIFCSLNFKDGQLIVICSGCWGGLIVFEARIM